MNLEVEFMIMLPTKNTSKIKEHKFVRKESKKT